MPPRSRAKSAPKIAYTVPGMKSGDAENPEGALRTRGAATKRSAARRARK